MEIRTMTVANKSGIALAWAGIMAFSGALWAQALPQNASPQNVAPPANTAMAAGGDAHFVMAASTGGDTEVIASHLASTNAQSPKIKAFAATMVRDHMAANDKLRTIAQKNGFALASTATIEQQPELVQLQNLHGSDFDKAYANLMRKDHQDAVALFTSESSTGNNNDLKAFAAQTLPTLQHHLQMAQSL
jgi:putative membrane protein